MAKRIGLLAFAVLAAVGMTEGAVALLLSGPPGFRRLPARVQRNVRDLYMSRVRDVIQFDPAAARYDPELYYTLKPGEFDFANSEFRVRFRVNSLGLRDAEDALKAPELIALGDSFTMGWGVEQDETYPSRLARATGLRTLNAGVAGYETVRQLRLLDRLDTSKLKVLLIQYGEGNSENTAFYCSKGRLDIGSPESYAAVSREQAEARRYRFGKYTRLALETLGGALRPRAAADAHAGPPPGCDPPADADLFLYALAHGTRKNLSGVKLVVFSIGSRRTRGREFLDTLRRRIDAGYGPAFAKRMSLAVLDDALDPSLYFAVDDHLNAAGQSRVASELLPLAASK